MMKVICRECRALQKGMDGGEVVGYRYLMEFNPRQGQSGISIDTAESNSYIVGTEYEVKIHPIPHEKLKELKKSSGA